MLELRYGLGGQHPRTLDEVGRRFNVTHERIRQIVWDALLRAAPVERACLKSGGAVSRGPRAMAA
jgi:RNA polymerase primary sigma factor